MQRESLHDGREDGLVPLESLDLGKVETFSDLLRGMSRTAFSGRQLGEALDIIVEMARDRECKTILTVSGAMTVAKQGLIICDMIDRGLVDAVVATGALIAHGLTEAMGLTHYRHDPAISDQVLFERGYNRIYDTVEMESNLLSVARLVASVLDEVEPEDNEWSSARFCRAVGERLAKLNQGPGILRSAFERDVPVYIPAFTDSEMGFDVSIWAMAVRMRDSEIDPAKVASAHLLQATPRFNPFLDLQHYAFLANRAERLGIITIGGGVPRNWAQQICPYFQITNDRLGTQLRVPRFRYGVRICPEPAHWGGLSGCSYSEGVSWGKFIPPSEGGRFSEVYADATIALPLLVKAAFEYLDRNENSQRP